MVFRQFLQPLLAAAVLLVAATASAQQVTRIIAPYSAGSGLDAYIRTIADEMTKRGIQTIVENKPGASGIIGAETAARAKPDGLTLFMGSNSNLANNVVLFKKLPYDPFKAFTPISHIGYLPNVLIARSNAPFKTLNEFIAYAKANKLKVNRASSGAGVISNLAGALMDKVAGIETVHIPYLGDPLAIQALLSDQVDVYVGTLTLALPHTQSGKLRILAVLDDKRLEQMPSVPTFKEAGYDLSTHAWFGLLAPTGTPAATVDRLNKVINEILDGKEFVAKAAQLAVSVRGGTPQEFGRHIQAEYDRWAPVITELGLAKKF